MTSKNRSEMAAVMAEDDPRAGSSLVPMLVSGLVLVVFGMIAAFALS